MSEEDCGRHPPSWVRAGGKCNRCEALREKRGAKTRAKRREWRANDPEWRAKQQAYMVAWHAEKRAKDPEYQAKQNARITALKRARRQALCDKVDAIRLTQDDVMDVIWAGLS